MKIIDLEEQHIPLYLVCLEDWSDEVKDAGDHKRVWYHKMKEKGLRVKLALDDRGTVGGMIQYLPIEHSFCEGTDLYFINCIWVHGHKQGRGDFQHRGMGKALLGAAEVDARALGAKGLVAWGLLIPVFMRAPWFKKHGYRTVERNGIQVLLWKPFTSDALPPKWIRQKDKPATEPGKVIVTALCNGWCPSANTTFERAKRAAAEPEFEGKVVFHPISTLDRAEFNRWGISDALFINKKQIWSGPPRSYESIKKLIAKQVRKLPH